MILDMTDPAIRRKVQLVSLIGALTIEIETGMLYSSKVSLMKVAKSHGFVGRLKKDALKWAIDQMIELDPSYADRIPRTASSLL